ncbi:hypothetical protein D3C72_1983660 [compost metagenome]
MKPGQVAADEVRGRSQHLQTGLDAGQFAIQDGRQIARQEDRVAENALFLDDVAFVDGDRRHDQRRRNTGKDQGQQARAHRVQARRPRTRAGKTFAVRHGAARS